MRAALTKINGQHGISSMKKLLYGLGILVLLLILSVVALTQFIDTDRIKRVLIEQTYEKTGRVLVLNGDISWRFFPAIGFTIQDAALLNPAGFASGNTLSVGEISLDVALRPLFNQQLDINEAVLNQARLHLITREDGVTNFDDLLDLSRGNSEPSEQKERQKEPQVRRTMEVSLARLNVVDAEVVLQNLASNRLMRMNRVNLTLEDFVPDQSAPLTFAGNLFSDDIQASINASGQFLLAVDGQQVRLDNLELEVAATGRAIPGNKQLQLQGDLLYDLKEKFAQFNKLDLTTDKLAVQGELALRHTSVPELTFDLTTDLLDIDALQAEWRATPSETTVKKTKVSNTEEVSQRVAESGVHLPTSVSAEGGNLSLLENIKVQGVLGAQQVRIDGVELEDLTLEIGVEQGVVELSSVQAELYQGQLMGQATFDTRATPLEFSVQQQLRGVDAKPFLTALADIDYIGGRADLNVDISGAGDNAKAIKKALAGSVGLNVNKGALYGIDITNDIRRAYAKPKGLPLPEKSGVEKTDFSELAADFTISKGKVSSNNMRATSSLLRLQGAGETDLLDESLDIQLTALLEGTLTAADGAKLTELKNIALPIQISGSYQDPKYRLDIQQVADIYLQDKANKEVERLKRKLDDKLGDKLGDKLEKKLPGLLNKLGL